MNSVLYFYFSICIDLNWHKQKKKIKKKNKEIKLIVFVKKKQIPFFVELKYWFSRGKIENERRLRYKYNKLKINYCKYY